MTGLGLLVTIGMFVGFILFILSANSVQHSESGLALFLAGLFLFLFSMYWGLKMLFATYGRGPTVHPMIETKIESAYIRSPYHNFVPITEPPPVAILP